MLMLCYHKPKLNELTFFTIMNPIEYPISHQKSLLLFLSGWLGLTLLSFVFFFLFWAFGMVLVGQEQISFFLQTNAFLSTVNFLVYLTLFIFALVTTYRGWIIWLREIITYTRWVKGIGYGFLVIITGALLGILYDVLGIQTTDNVNQETINTLVLELPILSFITFTLLGPIVEEFTYRIGLFTYVAKRQRWLAYLVTLTLFGFIHFNFLSPDLLNELINLPFYLIAGFLFCYIYEKEGFWVVTLAHITNNLISILSILWLASGGPSS